MKRDDRTARRFEYAGAPPLGALRAGKIAKLHLNDDLFSLRTYGSQPESPVTDLLPRDEDAMHESGDRSADLAWVPDVGLVPLPRLIEWIQAAVRRETWLKAAEITDEWAYEGRNPRALAARLRAEAEKDAP